MGRSHDTLQHNFEVISSDSVHIHYIWIVSFSISGSTPTILAAVYWPMKYCNVSLYDLSALLPSLCTLSPNIILEFSDFDIHVNNGSNTLTRGFICCLDSFGTPAIYWLSNSLRRPHSGPWLLGITPRFCVLTELPISDHKLVFFTVNVSLFKSFQHRSMSFRNFKNFNSFTLNTAINNLLWLDHSATPDDLISY